MQNQMTTFTSPRTIELLAPAKNSAIAIEAIRHGADAVYIGPEKFGARSAAGNSIADIAQVVEYAHTFNAKVYATVNTILFDSELKAAEKLIRQLYAVGVDALIIQDMGILRLDIPPIALHASTQCDIRTIEKAQFLEAVGFSQLVLARELTLGEIKAICDNVSIPVECFVHGALCVSYSGRCHASYALKGRSANRGECAQICRLAYDLTDDKGNTILKNKHLLSLCDLNQSDNLEKLLEAGVSSFKIEGRLKETAYVKNVTAGYSLRLNEICQKEPCKYSRASSGSSQLNFEPVFEKSFNRGFTHYFSNNRQPQTKMASLNTPKSIGEPIGKVTRTDGNRIYIATTKPLANGDGFVFFNASSSLDGFRANKAEGKCISTLEKKTIPRGCPIFRNYDKAFSDLLAKNSAMRKIAVDASMRLTPEGFALSVSDEAGNKAIVSTKCSHEIAKTDQTEARIRIFSKLGETDFVLRKFDPADTSCFFIPASVLSDIRRNAIRALQSAKKACYHFEYRKKEDMLAIYPQTHLIYADNVANLLARQFYADHGVCSMEPAMETEGDGNYDILMTTRYCLRRELGYCLKGQKGNQLGKQLYLSSGDIRMSVDFDCRNCQMVLRKAKSI